MRALEQLDELVDWRATIAWGDYHGDKQPIRGAAQYRAVEITVVDGEGNMSFSQGYGASFLEALEDAAQAAASALAGNLPDKDSPSSPR